MADCDLCDRLLANTKFGEFQGYVTHDACSQLLLARLTKKLCGMCGDENLDDKGMCRTCSLNPGNRNFPGPQ